MMIRRSNFGRTASVLILASLHRQQHRMREEEEGRQASQYLQAQFQQAEG